MKKLIILPIFILSFTGFAQESLNRFNDNFLKNIKIEELPTNTSLSDFGPCIVDGSLFYTSFNDDVKSDSKKNRSKSYYDLFTVNIDKTGKVNSVRRMVSELAEEYHVGPNSYNSRTEELMVTRNNADDPMITPYKPFQKKALNLEMVLAKKDAGQWKIEGEFQHNNKNYSVGHPAFTPTGDTLIFASDMPGGYGGTDLYMSIRLADGWTTPRNLGSRINTPGKEFTPFVTDNGILIFASNGFEGREDLDLYFTQISNENLPVVKMPEPLNSEYDDFGMIIDKSHLFGYFTTNRPGTGSDDIYRIDFNATLASLNGKVINKITREPINQATVEFNPPIVVPEITYSDPEGKFTANIPAGQVNEVTGSKEGYKSETVKINGKDNVLIELMPEIFLELSVRDAETEEYLPETDINFNNEENFKPQPGGIATRQLTPAKQYYIRGTLDGYLDNSLTIGADGEPGLIKATLWMYKGVLGKSFVLENIYYDFDKWDILPQSAVELDKLIRIMNENPGLKVELGSHTDSRGTDQYNEWLANKRSSSAVAYIKQKGIAASHITAKGYGENQPYIADPKNESEHRLNRRTTFTITELDSSVPKMTSVASDQSMYGKYTGQAPVMQGQKDTPSNASTKKFDLPEVNVQGTNYRVQFYASVKPININKAMSGIVDKFSQYGLIDLEEDFLIKYQIGPFNNLAEGTKVFNEIKKMGYQVMLLEYNGNKRVKMVLPD